MFTNDNEISQAISSIRLWYDAGLPLFTRQMLEEIDEKLEAFRSKTRANMPDPIISLSALNGNIVDFEIGEERSYPVAPGTPAANSDSEWVETNTYLDYRSIQSLTSKMHNYVPRFAYCSIQITGFLKLRNKHTKKLLEETVPAPTFDDIHELIQAIRKNWETSTAYQQLKSTLKSLTTPCDKIVALACGTMSTGDRHASRCAYQHALILSLRDALLERKKDLHTVSPEEKFICYAQDPAYTDVDCSVLAAHGITFIHDPKGFLEIDSSSAVISIAPDVPVRQIVAELAQPAMMIWSKPNPRLHPDYPKDMISADPMSPRVEKLIENYDMHDFKGDWELFGDLGVYLKRSLT